MMKFWSEINIPLFFLSLLLFQITGTLHVGDMINVFRHGSLIMQQAAADQTVQTSGSILYGTVHGSIGIITQLSPDLFNFLKELQGKLAKQIKSVGKIEHEEWRCFKSDKRTEMPQVRLFLPVKLAFFLGLWMGSRFSIFL